MHISSVFVNIRNGQWTVESIFCQTSFSFALLVTAGYLGLLFADSACFFLFCIMHMKYVPDVSAVTEFESQNNVKKYVHIRVL